MSEASSKFLPNKSFLDQFSGRDGEVVLDPGGSGLRVCTCSKSEPERYYRDDILGIVLINLVYISFVVFIITLRLTNIPDRQWAELPFLGILLSPLLIRLIISSKKKRWYIEQGHENGCASRRAIIDSLAYGKHGVKLIRTPGNSHDPDFVKVNHGGTIYFWNRPIGWIALVASVVLIVGLAILIRYLVPAY